VLTVLIATHNGAATLPRVLASYRRLGRPPGDWRLVVIDNASDDGSARIARGFAGSLPLVTVSEPRRGKNRALNTGLRALEGDLAVFGDDDGLPDSDWLVRLRGAADRHPDYGVFGGAVQPLWARPPRDWILRWVRLAPVFGVTDPAWADGPCEPTRVWGANMAIRAEFFAKGHRFDERLGPDGSDTAPMGGETELTLRLAIAEGARCWHCRNARVRHIIPSHCMTPGWILRRAFRLGRCVYRESRQKAAAGLAHVPRGEAAIGPQLVRATVGLARARAAGNARQAFEAQWDLSLWLGCLFEARNAQRGPRAVRRRRPRVRVIPGRGPARSRVPR
jgi:glycosyltransferase involved in cell wall biosynthesis